MRSKKELSLIKAEILCPSLVRNCHLLFCSKTILIMLKGSLCFRTTLLSSEICSISSAISNLCSARSFKMFLGISICFSLRLLTNLTPVKFCSLPIELNVLFIVTFTIGLLKIISPDLLLITFISPLLFLTIV